MKKIAAIHRNDKPHWVGNGFHVHSLFFYGEQGEAISPFLLLDYGAPKMFSPSEEQRGVGKHPHRGFETVTIAYQGSVEHRDSAGHHGTIGPGDVQWMTAAGGIVHEEWHEREFTRQGGIMEMVQLWVNLPAKDKMSAPRYQDIRKEQIPVITEGTAQVRIIAGELRGVKGPARTFTPVNVWDARVPAEQRLELEIPDGYTGLLVVLKGSVSINGQSVQAVSLVTMERAGTQILIEASEDANVLVLSGEPISEPVVGYGPFVMNTEAEIRQAVSDYQNGRLTTGSQA